MHARRRFARLLALPFTLLVAGLATGAFARDEAELPAGRDFGAALTLRQPTALAEILAAPERHTAEPVLLRGKLTDVCQKKGCWTVLADGEVAVRVRFADYGFFLPKDATGSRALVEGVVTVRTLSEREARHYAAESRAGDPEAIEGPRREVGFLANGVRLVPAD